MASTVAIATRRRSPIESRCGERSAASPIRTAASASSHPRGHLVAREAEVQRAERDVLAHGGHEELVVGVLEDEPDPRAQLAQRRRADLEARDLELARRRSAGR